MKILHIDCSPRDNSHSRALSSAIIGQLVEHASQTEIVRRDLGREPLPHAFADYAEALASPANLNSAQAEAATQLSEQLIQEVEQADVVVIGTPMNNFTVPSVLKAWLDQVLRVGRTIGFSAGGDKKGLLQDKPVYIAVAAGGVFSGERAKQPDFLTPYLTAALGCIGLTSVHYFPLQGTAFLSEEQLQDEQQQRMDDLKAILQK